MAKKSNPLVSVLMTVFNREKYIAEAIESVLHSTYNNFELIIVDDCSTDKSVIIARSYLAKDSRIKLFINDHNLGDYPNRNKAASYAKGKYIKYVDSDDMIYPDSLKIMVKAMESDSSLIYGFSSKTSDEITIFSPLDAYRCHFYNRSLFHHGPTSAIIRTKYFRELNGFMELRNVSDYDFWLKASAQFNIIELPKGLVYWRIHDDQEFNKASELYLRYNYEITINNLTSTSCPMEKKEVSEIINKLKRKLAIECYKNILKVKNIKFSIFLIFKYKLLPFI